jgi:hypothetical protein
MATPASYPKIRFTALALALSLYAGHAQAAFLSSSEDCGARGSLQCKLDSILNLLDGLSIILGIVLLVIIAIAVRIYVKNRNSKKLLP